MTTGLRSWLDERPVAGHDERRAGTGGCLNGDYFGGTRDALDYEGLLALLLPQSFHGR